MAVFDGTDVFAGDKGVSSNRINKTVLWRGDTLPENPNNEVPVDGIFFKIDEGRFYRNTGTVASPVWTLIPSGGVTGEIKMFTAAIASIPIGFLLCDGAAVSETTYANLFALIGYTYGNPGGGDFNLPNFVTDNKFPRAATGDGNLGDTGGESTHSLDESETGPHTHDIDTLNIFTGSVGTPGTHYRFRSGQDPEFNNNVNSLNPLGIGGSDVGIGTLTTNGGGVAHENKPPFIDIHFIIAT